MNKGKVKIKICRLLILAFLLVAGVAGIGDPTEAKSGTWKKDKKGWWYSYSDGTYAKNQWVRSGGKWYYFGSDGYMETSAYRQGYWLDKNGAASTKNIGGTWKKSNGYWWYTDKTGWYPKSQWLKINGKEYYFLASGYLATNRYIGDYYVNSDGAWVAGKKAVDWPSIYKKFLSNRDYLGKGQTFSSEQDTCVALFDINHDGIPELLFNCWDDMPGAPTNSYVYSCASGKTEYIGEGSGTNWYYVTDSKNPEGVLCSSYSVWSEDYSSHTTYSYWYTLSGKKLTEKQYTPGKSEKSHILRDVHISDMILELQAYEQIRDMENPTEWLSGMKNFLRNSTYASVSFDCRTDEPFSMDEVWGFGEYPTDPVLYDGNRAYGTGKYQYDPKGRFDSWYCQLSGKKTDWILRNVYNCSDQAVANMKKIDDGSSESAYYQDGSYYTRPYDADGSVSVEICVKDIKKVNGLYKISFNRQRYFLSGDLADSIPLYSVMEQKKVSGREFWSQYICGENKISDSTVKSIQKKKVEKLP